LFGVQPYFNKYYRPLSDFSLPFLDYESLNLGNTNIAKTEQELIDTLSGTANQDL
jgi:hypothetical protein